MTTRLGLRTSVRARLEDETASPLWSDQFLNEAIGSAIQEYGVRFPAERTTVVSLATGARRVALAAGSVDPARIARVIDARGRIVPPARDDDPGSPGEQCWRWWNDGLNLGRAIGASGESWQIEHRGGRAAPTDDVAALDVQPGDEPIVLALAAAIALERRAVEDGKRGIRSGALALADAVRGEAERLLRARGRQPRMTG